MNDKDRVILMRYWSGKLDDVIEDKPEKNPPKAPIQSLKNSPLLDKIHTLLKNKQKEMEDDSDWT